MDITEIEQMLARFKEADLADSQKTFAECLLRDEDSNVVGAFCNGNVVSANDISSLSRFKPTKLTLWHCKFEGDVVSTCAELPTLEELTFFGCPIRDEQMLTVSRLTNLKKLDVRGIPITDQGLVPIGSMTHLEELVLLGTKITSRGMTSVSELSSLRKLCLTQTSVDDSGMEALASLKMLEHLDLEGSHISNAGLEFVGRLTELKGLTIHNIEAVDENGLKHLENLKKLETLYLCVPVTKNGTAALKKMTALVHLYMGDVISDTPFNHQRLERELPGVGVY